MSSDVLTVLRDAKCHREYGRHREAVITLQDALITVGNRVELVVELGETLLDQGYFARAAELLGEHLALSDDSNNLHAAGGKVIGCLASFHATGLFKEPLLHAERIYQRYLSSTDSEVVDDTTVWFPRHFNVKGLAKRSCITDRFGS